MQLITLDTLPGLVLDRLTSEFRFQQTCDGCTRHADLLVYMGIGGYRCPRCRRAARKHAPRIERKRQRPCPTTPTPPAASAPSSS